MSSRITLCPVWLGELLAVDAASTTWLTWIKKPAPCSPIRVGNAAGSIGSAGYYRIKMRNRTYLNHRIIWTLSTGYDPGAYQIDHIDGNRTNNDPGNLRLASHRLNSQNKINRSRYGIGVKFRDGKYQARIRIDGKLIHLGTFDIAESASAAYQSAAACLPLPGQEVSND